MRKFCHVECYCALQNTLFAQLSSPEMLASIILLCVTNKLCRFFGTPNRFCELCFRMDATTKKPVRLVPRLWQALSSSFASLLVLAAILMLGYWAVTGTSMSSQLEGQQQLQSEAISLRLAVSLLLCTGLAVFLATYVLNSVLRGCAGAGFLVLMIVPGENFDIATILLLMLVLMAIVIGAVAGRYLNNYSMLHCNSRFTHTAFRASILALCFTVFLIFPLASDMPYWVCSLYWMLQCSAFSSGAVQSIWRRSPDPAIAA